MAETPHKKRKRQDDAAEDDAFSPKRSCQDFNDSIKVIVGESEPESVFTIHKDVLCATSRFFKAACSRSWAEGHSKVVRLPEEDPGIFRVYAAWVYSGKLAVDVAEGATDIEDEEQDSLLKSWLLGDVLDDLRFRNQAMKTFVEKDKSWTQLPSSHLLGYVYKSTPPSSLLRKMLVDLIRLDVIPESFAFYGVDFPPELVLEIAASLLKQQAELGNSNAKSFADNLQEYLEPEEIEASEKDK